MKNLISGFTLLEMLLSIAIFGILTAVVIYNYGDFNSQIILTNMTYETALEIRQAQVYSLGVRRNVGVEDGNVKAYETNYGVFFNKVDQLNDQFIYFGDVGDENGVCNPGSGSGFCTCSETGSECISPAKKFTHNVKIVNICVGNSDVLDTTTGSCKEENFNTEQVFITFNRPDPDAIIVTNFNQLSNQKKSRAAIVLASPNGRMRAIQVYDTGQISVINVGNN